MFKNFSRRPEKGRAVKGYGRSENLNESKADKSVWTEKPEQPTENAFKQVSWGPVGATIAVAIGLVLGGLVSTLLVGGWVWLNDRSVGLAGITDAVSGDISLIFVTYSLSQVVLAAVVLGYVRYRGGGLRDLGFRKFKISKAAWIVIVGFIGFLLTAAGLSLLIEQFLPQVDINAEQQVPFIGAKSRVEILLAFVAIAVIAPIVEEMVFRGLLLPAAAKAFGIPAAVIVTSVIFGLLHPPAIAMVTIGVFGLFLSWAYIRGLSLWPAIILHSVKNLIALISIIGVGL